MSQYRHAGTSKNTKKISYGYNFHVLSLPVVLFYKYTIESAYFFRKKINIIFFLVPTQFMLATRSLIIARVGRNQARCPE